MPPSVDVIMPIFNERDTLDRTLRSVEAQTLSAHKIWIADGGSTDGSIELVKEWRNTLPITLLENPEKRQSFGLNKSLEESESTYVARLDGHTFWSTNYLDVLVGALERNNSLGAAGAVVRPDPESNRFQKNVWSFMCHVLGTGGPSYRTELDEATRSTSVQSPVYRREALEEVGRFREDLPWAEDDELHVRLRKRNWDLYLNPEAQLFYMPRSTFRDFCRQMNHYGRGRGQLARRGIVPSRRHKIIDRLMIIWTFALVWNPIGWGFALFYSLSLFPIVAKEWMEGNGGWPLLFLFPAGQVSYWLGWLATRFVARTELAPDGGQRRE